MLIIIKFCSSAYAQMPEAKLGWKLGVQAWTFKNGTFEQALKKADSCRLKYIEAYPKQPIGGNIEGIMD